LMPSFCAGRIWWYYYISKCTSTHVLTIAVHILFYECYLIILFLTSFLGYMCMHSEKNGTQITPKIVIFRMLAFTWVL
jgi:hypothetical protein